MSLSAMAAGAMTVVRQCAAVSPGEHVLILTDDGMPRAVPDALAFAAASLGGVPVVVVMPRRQRPGQEPPPLVADAMKRAQVILAPTSVSVFHTQASRAAAACGARMLALSECREETLVRGGIQADFRARAEVAARLAGQLRGEVLELSTPAGTRLRSCIGGRTAVANTGLAHRPGERSGLPTIEAYVAPLEGTTEGVVVVDASGGTIGLVPVPVVIQIREGRAVEFGGGPQARTVEGLVAQVGHRDAAMLSEVGIGLNPRAEVVGRIIEDEGTYGTCHVALGSNSHFGGRVEVPFHLDLVMWRPDVSVDGRVLMRRGRLVEEAQA